MDIFWKVLIGWVFFYCMNVQAVDGEKLKIITTFTVIADIVQNVAGNLATVESITKPNAEIHNYQVTPQDIKRAYGSDLILYNGLNLEIWFDKFYKNIGPVPKVILSDGVQPLSISRGPYSGNPNPHAWMSPKNVLIYVDNILESLKTLDSKNEASYTKNAVRYKQEIIDLAKHFRIRFLEIPAEKRWLVTSEGAFSYLADDFEFFELFIWPINADGNGTPDQIKSVIEQVKKKDIAVVFSESTVSSKPAKQVARETGAKYGGVLFVDSLTDQEGIVPTYLDLLEVTLTTILRGFNE